MHFYFKLHVVFAIFHFSITIHKIYFLMYKLIINVVKNNTKKLHYYKYCKIDCVEDVRIEEVTTGQACV